MIVNEVDLAGLRIVVECRGRCEHAGEAVVHAQRADIQRVVRVVGGRSSHLRHAVFDDEYILRVGGRQSMTCHQTVVDLHVTAANRMAPVSIITSFLELVGSRNATSHLELHVPFNF